MKWNLAAAAVMFILIGIPLIAINLGALGMQARVEQAVTGETVVPEPIADAGDRVLNVWGDFRENQTIDALFVEDRFTRRRSVRYTETVSIADMLKDGEAAPDPEFEELWVLARASERALRNECPALLDTFARSCAVSSAEVESTSDEGTYRIEAVVGYLPDEPLGSTKIDGARDLYRSYFTFPASGGPRLPLESAVAAKRALYGEADRLCDNLRETRGNCVLANIELKTRSPRDDGTVQFYVTGGLYTVGPAGSKPEGVDLVGTFGETVAGPQASRGAEGLALMAVLARLFGSGPEEASEGAGPRILRGAHTRYGGSDGRFIQARER